MISFFTKTLTLVLLLCSAASARTFSIGNTQLLLDDDFLASLDDEQAAYLEHQLQLVPMPDQLDGDEEFVFVNMEVIEANEIQGRPTQGTQPPTN